MTRLFLGALLALTAVSLGLRTTAVLIPRLHPLLRVLLSMVIGSALVLGAMQMSDRYAVHDLGLGLLLSLAPVGIYDLAKWWFRWKR